MPFDLIPGEAWTLPNGVPVSMRRMLRADLPNLKTLLEGLSSADLRSRFHVAMSKVSGTHLCGMFEIEQPGQFALAVVAQAQQRNPLVAEARYAMSSQGGVADVAVIVSEDWRRLGIGTRLLGALYQAATAHGLARLHASVLTDNDPMLRLLGRLHAIGMTRHVHAGTLEIEVTLGRAS